MAQLSGPLEDPALDEAQGLMYQGFDTPDVGEQIALADKYSKRVLCKQLVVLAVVLTALGCATVKRPVFPGAEGFGIFTPAGRGGKVIRVTNLHSEGAGSLSEALTTKGPRIIVFEVGGVIDLNKKKLEITQPYLTVAGQTAPSPGITIIRGSIIIKTHDVVIQHIRVRPGDAGEPKRSGWAPDGISTWGGAAYNIVIDHCSVSWAVDENMSASGPGNKGSEATSRRITFSNCIIVEGLDNSSHKKGRHSKGSLVHDFCSDVAVIGNLYAHNADRNPYFKAHTTGVVVNNVIYNPVHSAIKVNSWTKKWQNMGIPPKAPRLSVVGNVMIPGNNTRQGLALVTSKQENLALVTSEGDVYLEDNVVFDHNGNLVSLTSGPITILKERFVWPTGLEALPAHAVIDYVVRRAGARPKDRDQVDKRIIRELQERKGSIIDSQSDVGGYPRVEMTKRKLQVPEKNIEEWLARLASDLE